MYRDSLVRGYNMNIYRPIQTQLNHQRYLISQRQGIVQNQRNNAPSLSRNYQNQTQFNRNLNTNTVFRTRNPCLKKMSQAFAEIYKSYKFKYAILGLIQLILFASILTKQLLFHSQQLEWFGQDFPIFKSLKLVVKLLLIFFVGHLIMRCFIYLYLLNSVDFAIRFCNNLRQTSLDEPYNQSQSFEQNTSKIIYAYLDGFRYITKLSEQKYEKIQKQIFSEIQNFIDMHHRYISIAHKYQNQELVYAQQLQFQIYLCTDGDIWVDIFHLILFVIQNEVLGYHFIRLLDIILLLPILIYWVINEPHQMTNILLIIFVITFSPIILIYLVFTYIQQKCSQFNSRGQRQLSDTAYLILGKIPLYYQKPRNPTQQQIVKHGNSCSICLICFTIGDKVLFFPCEGKHMFHNLCLREWLKMKTTCPNCRTSL